MKYYYEYFNHEYFDVPEITASNMLRLHTNFEFFFNVMAERDQPYQSMTENEKLQDIPEDWKGPFKKGDMKHPLLEESSFAILFPHYRERYLTEIWPKLTNILDNLGIKAEIDTKEGVMIVRTTDQTWDPVAILNCRDMLKLLARSVPLEQASRVLEDGVESLILVIGRDIRNLARFTKRRQRLIGPNGETLKALELLTKCYIMVQGHTVSAIGDQRGLDQIKKVVEDCMKNIHPVYHIKTLMVKHQLAKDPNLKNADWDPLLPKFQKLASKKKAKKVKRKKRNKDALPAYPVESEIDRQIESGEYFLKQKGSERRKKNKKQEKMNLEEKKAPEDIKVQTESEAKKTEVASAIDIAKNLKNKA